MTARFRLVHYVTDPFLGGRVPMAALVETEGRVAVERVPKTPGPDCLGGRAAAAVFRIILADLERASGFDVLDPRLGPHVVLGPARVIPCEFGDPIEWVRRFVAGDDYDPEERAGDEARERVASPAPRRARVGMAFLKRYSVAEYVSHRFKPQVHASGALRAAHDLPSITHFVAGVGELLLMEPLLFTQRSDKHIVQRVATTLAAYRQVITQERPKIDARLLAYMLPGGTREERTAAVRSVGRFAHTVVDTEAPSMREEFVSEVRRVGTSAKPELAH